MRLSLTIVPAFEFEQNGLYCILSLLWIFLNSKTSVATNLKSFNSVNKPISVFLIADSVSLTCSSGLKELMISTL